MAKKAKSKTPKTRKKTGRPPKVTKEVLLALEYAFRSNCSDEEACGKVGICPATLYLYQKEHPEFLEQKRIWKRDQVAKAKFALSKVLDEKNPDINTVKWVLERRDKAEYGNHVAIDAEVRETTQIVLPDQMTREQWEEAQNNNDS